MENQSLDSFTDLYIALLNSKRTKVPNCPDYLKYVNEVRIKYEMILHKETLNEWISQGGKVTKEEIEKVKNDIKTPLMMEQMIEKFIHNV